MTTEREDVEMLKRAFIGWRIPPVELPAESVIIEVVHAIREASFNEGYAQRREEESDD